MSFDLNIISFFVWGGGVGAGGVGVGSGADADAGVGAGGRFVMVCLGSGVGLVGCSSVVWGGVVVGGSVGSGGRARDATGHSVSPVRARGSRLVARTLTLGAAESS